MSGCFSDWVLDVQEAVSLEDRYAEQAAEDAAEAAAEREAGERPVAPAPGRSRKPVVMPTGDDIPF